jgi:hypothetical protein
MAAVEAGTTAALGEYSTVRVAGTLPTEGAFGQMNCPLPSFVAAVDTAKVASRHPSGG